MAGPLRVQFIGGPCDATTKLVPADIVSSGSLVCNGQVYVVDPKTANPVFARLASAAEKANVANLSYDPKLVFSAFQGLMRTLAIGVPAEMRGIRADLNRIRKAVK
jgi:hypothetical protein